MKRVTFLKSAGLLSIVVLLVCVSQVWAEEEAKKDIRATGMLRRITTVDR
jgi:hypothetical protein